MILPDDLSEEDLTRISWDGTDDEKRAVARHPNTNVHTLLFLARKGFVEEADQNPLMLLHVEAGSPDVVLLLVEIASKTTRPERLEELASSPWVAVRSRAAWNKHMPPAMLAILGKEHSEVLYAVAGNVNTPMDTLTLLSRSKDYVVRKYANDTLAEINGDQR
jgi:hypothetical protein